MECVLLDAPFTESLCNRNIFLFFFNLFNFFIQVCRLKPDKAAQTVGLPGSVVHFFLTTFPPGNTPHFGNALI
jgi:hypothetical protein